MFNDLKFAILLFSLLFSMQIAASVCDNSTVTINNRSGQAFDIVNYMGRTNSNIKLTSGSGKLPPQHAVSFTVTSGPLSAGDALGKITLTGQKRKFEVYYAFTASLIKYSCTTDYDIYVNKYEELNEHYKVDCKAKNAIPASIVCSISSN